MTGDSGAFRKSSASAPALQAGKHSVILLLQNDPDDEDQNDDDADLNP
jgi:hypothetical protein